jgi:hypothetical protein
LKSKAAETHFSAPIPPAKKRGRKRSPTREPNPIRFTTTQGTARHAWLASNTSGKRIVGDEVHWGVNVVDLLARETKKKPRAITAWHPTPKALRRPIIVVGHNEPVRHLDDALGTVRGISARVFISEQEQLQILGCGQRRVIIQLRGKRVLLHHNGNTAAMKRPEFKEFIARNKAARNRHRAYLAGLVGGGAR